MGNGLGLVIRRRSGDSFYIGETLVTVVAVGRRVVVLRVKAPQELQIVINKTDPEDDDEPADEDATPILVDPEDPGEHLEPDTELGGES